MTIDSRTWPARSRRRADHAGSSALVEQPSPGSSRPRGARRPARRPASAPPRGEDQAVAADRARRARRARRASRASACRRRLVARGHEHARRRLAEERDVRIAARPAARSTRPVPAATSAEASTPRARPPGRRPPGRARRRSTRAVARLRHQRVQAPSRASRSSRGGRPGDARRGRPSGTRCRRGRRRSRRAGTRRRLPPANGTVSAHDASSSRPTTATVGVGWIAPSVGLVVERDVAARDGRAQRAAGLADAPRSRAPAGPSPRASPGCRSSGSWWRRSARAPDAATLRQASATVSRAPSFGSSQP